VYTHYFDLANHKNSLLSSKNEDSELKKIVIIIKIKIDKK